MPQATGVHRRLPACILIRRHALVAISKYRSYARVSYPCKDAHGHLKLVEATFEPCVGQVRSCVARSNSCKFSVKEISFTAKAILWNGNEAGNIPLQLYSFDWKPWFD